MLAEKTLHELQKPVKTWYLKKESVEEMYNQDMCSSFGIINHLIVFGGMKKTFRAYCNLIVTIL